MKVLRLSAGAVALASLVAVAWGAGAGGCGTPLAKEYNCAIGDPTETGADGGADPCHCANPGGGACACTSPDEFQNSGFTGKQLFQFCLQSLEDAGDDAEGGPLLACDGDCWPLPPPDWTPVLLRSGAESDAGACPNVAPALIFAGNAYDASGTFAIGCSSTASGACPGLGDVCGPGPLDGEGFQFCVMHDGNVPCVSVGPQPAYPAWSVFYEGTPPEPIEPFTFCCFPSLPSH